MLDWTLLERPAALWISALSLLVVVALGVPILRSILQRRFGKDEEAAPTWRSLVAQLNQRWARLSTLCIALALAVLLLDLSPRITFWAMALLLGTLVLQGIRLVPAVVDWALRRVLEGETGGAGGNRTTITGLRWVILILVDSLIVLLALQNLGVNVTAMVAGLGIGGIAIALAVQSILGDLFASLTIALDQPFVVGDFIVVGTEMGTVEYVGLKTTRVRSLSGEQLVFANSDLLSSRIRNYKRMQERRVVFGFGVVYSTPPEALEAIPGVVRTLVESQPNLRFDRCHFFRFGASSLDFEAVYYIASPDYNAHMDAQQAIHLAINREFGARGIDFAFPTQTIHVAGAAAPPVTRPD